MGTKQKRGVCVYACFFIKGLRPKQQSNANNRNLWDKQNLMMEIILLHNTSTYLIEAKKTPAMRRETHAELLLRAVCAAKTWIGTDAVRRRLVTERGGRPWRRRPAYAPGRCWLADLAPLDDRMDDPDALYAWLRAGLVHADDPDDPRPYPRLFPLRWRNHYTALVRRDPRGPLALFDPHAGHEPRWYAEPPLDVVRRAADDVGADVDPVVVVDNGRGGTSRRRRPPQRERADTFCVVWMTAFFCRLWRPHHGLADVWRFLLACVRANAADFQDFCRRDLCASPVRAQALYRALADASVADYRAAFYRGE